MKHSAESLVGYKVKATNGELGHVDEFYFDDRTWTLRYLIVKTGHWLSERKVLISPAALGKPVWKSKTFSVNLTTDQVKNSPDIDTQKPVYRQHEHDLVLHYGWPLYWTPDANTGAIYGTAPLLPVFEEPELPKITESAPISRADQWLRSTKRVAGYQIHAIDGEIGHVRDFIVDDENWTIPFLVVNTGNWLSGKKVLIAPQWIKDVSWETSEVMVDISREAVRNSPHYDPKEPVSQDDAGELYDYYGRPKSATQAKNWEPVEFLWDTKEDEPVPPFPTNDRRIHTERRRERSGDYAIGRK